MMYDHTDNEYIFDDTVRKQYMVLPYPPISETLMSQEKHYYRNNVNKIPINSHQFRDMTLNNINHYLFQGLEDFRYVSNLLILMWAGYNLLSKLVYNH